MWLDIDLLSLLLPGMVDCIFADVAQPDQARIVAINAHHFLKNEGHVVISIKVSEKRLMPVSGRGASLNAIDSRVSATIVNTFEVEI